MAEQFGRILLALHNVWLVLLPVKLVCLLFCLCLSIFLAADMSLNNITTYVSKKFSSHLHNVFLRQHLMPSNFALALAVFQHLEIGMRIDKAGPKVLGHDDI